VRPRSTYALVSPVRDERFHLETLAQCVFAQTVPPSEWVIVDSGSTDGTTSLAAELERQSDSVRVLTLSGTPSPTRGGPVVRAFQAGIAGLLDVAEVVVKLDADVSFVADFFARLMTKFDEDGELGIASGVRLEEVDGRWMPRHQTATMVRAQVRAYRRRCLEQLLPLEERVGWDTIDQLKANVLGWRTREFQDLFFRHHRREGLRDGKRYWRIQGKASHYIGYRPLYLALRALHRGREDPAALMMLLGYAEAALRGEATCPDPQVRALVRSQQSLLRLKTRLGEVRRGRG